MTKTEKPICSIVIRAFNEEEHIGRLLSGILQQSEKDVEIILVDSGSTDATLAIASRFPVQVLSIDPKDFTFGRSLNLGCRHARGEYLMLASAHVFPVYPDWIERLLEPFSDPKIGLVYGKQRGGEGTHFSERQHFAKMYPDQSTSHQDHPLCNNANASLRRSLWERHGYDESLPGLEDVAWASWAMSQGFRIAYSAEAEVVHIHNETPSQVYNRYRREAIALKHIMPDERFRLWDFVRLTISNIASDLWHASQQGALRSSLGSIVWFRTMHLWGTYRGFAHRGPLTRDLKQVFYYPRKMGIGSPIPQRSAQPIDYGALLEQPQEGPANAD